MTSADVENSDVALVEKLEMLAQEMGKNHALRCAFDQDYRVSEEKIGMMRPEVSCDEFLGLPALAKHRAQAVAKLLTDGGIAADRIEMRKPQTITAGSDGADKQARRVDIVAAQ